MKCIVQISQCVSRHVFKNLVLMFCNFVFVRQRDFLLDLSLPPPPNTHTQVLCLNGWLERGESRASSCLMIDSSNALHGPWLVLKLGTRNSIQISPVDGRNSITRVSLLPTPGATLTRSSGMPTISLPGQFPNPDVVLDKVCCCPV